MGLPKYLLIHSLLDLNHLHMNTQNSPFFTIQEVSEFLGISISTINRLIKEGDFPPKVKLSPRRMVFMKREIDEWIESKRINN